jgi:4-amino-4-deoxy-L-arabinose transferase-like glycosyltransferase
MASRRVVISLLAAGFLLRVGIVLLTGAYASPQLWEFDPVANNIVGGRGYVYSTPVVESRGIGFPLYMYLTAGVYLLFGSYRYLGALFLQSFFTLALSLIVYLLGRYFSDRVGLLAMGLVITHPGLLYYETQTLHSLTFTALFVGASVWAFVRLSLRPTTGRAAACGMIVGLAVLAHPTVGLFAVPAWALTLKYSRLGIGEAAKRVGVFALAVAAMAAPWAIRNYVVFNRVILVSTASGESFWRGNNPYSTGTSRAETGEPVLQAAPEEFRQRVFGLSEVERDQFFRREAWNFITRHPGDALSLFARKLFAFWWFSPQSGQYYPQHYMSSYKAYYGAVLLLSLVGFASLWARGAEAHTRMVAGMLASAFVTLSVAQSFFYVEGRHRWNIESLLLIVSALGVWTVARHARHLSFRRLVCRV